MAFRNANIWSAFLQVLYEDCRHVQLTQPYISGFLAFREVPFLVEQVDRLREQRPELIPQVRLGLCNS